MRGLPGDETALITAAHVDATDWGDRREEREDELLSWLAACLEEGRKEGRKNGKA